MIKQDIKLSVDMLVFSALGGELAVLLVQRKNDPYKGHWSFPGGFVEDDEVLTHAASRELKEETGIDVIGFKQMQVYDAVDRDPRFRTVSVAHYAIVNAGEHIIKAGDDAADARWWLVKDIKPEELAFDHNEELAYAMAHLQVELNTVAPQHV